MRTLVPALCLALTSACGLATAGAACSSEGDCRTELTCAGTDRADLSVCMTPCDPSDTTLCDDGSACLEVDGRFVCYLGGATPHGDPCTQTLQCEPGTICPAEYSTCLQRCTVGMDAPCAGWDVCSATATGGVCRPNPDAGGDARP